MKQFPTRDRDRDGAAVLLGELLDLKLQNRAAPRARDRGPGAWVRGWSAAKRPTVSFRTIAGAYLSRSDEADSEGTDEGIGSHGNRSRCAIFCRPTIYRGPLHRCGPANGRADDAFARNLLRSIGRRPFLFPTGRKPAKPWIRSPRLWEGRW